MRLRDHLLSSALLGAICYMRSPDRALLVLIGGVLIDLDHVAIYGLKTGDWSIAGAIHYDRYRHRPPGLGDTRPRYGTLRSWLHRPLLVLPMIWWLASRLPSLRPVALGLSLHLLLDYWQLPLDWRAILLAGGRCEQCGQAAAWQVRLRADSATGRPRRFAICEACLERQLHGS
jgi:hypothetical protein